MQKTEIEIPKEIIEKFLKETHDASISTKADIEVASFKEGYLTALCNNYLKNNGIPIIPFPVSLSTVDMIAYCEDNEPMIMLGRKPGQDKWQFPGGFRDPSETSRKAASRELLEEACIDIDEKRFMFIDELFIDDIRYKNKPHKITTTIFFCLFNKEETLLPVAGDDLGEIKWFTLEELCKDDSIIRNIHIPIFEILKNYLFNI